MAAIVTNIPLTSATVENLSRHEMLLWVNECLQAEFGKIEQLHTGAGYSLFTEVLFPGSIQLKKVKFNSRIELDWLSNWKLVQTAWKQLGIEKVIPVEKLIKGKFQDNFEFLQWFKKFFDANYDGHEYNPLEMRNFEELPKEGKLKPGSASGAGSSLKMPQSTQKSGSGTRSSTITQQRAGSNASMSSTGVSASGAAAGQRKSAPTPTQKSKPAPPATNNVRVAAAQAAHPPPQQAAKQQPAQVVSAVPDIHLLEELKHKDQMMDELRTQLAESDDVICGLEKERDFYFAKLRKIEVLCQDSDASGALGVNDVLQILYETEEGFAPPEEAETNGGEEKNGVA